MTIYRKQRKAPASRGRAVYGSAHVSPAQPVVPDSVVTEPAMPEPAMPPMPEPPAVGAFATEPPAQAGLFSDDLFGGALDADPYAGASQPFGADAQAATQDAAGGDAPVYDVPAENPDAVVDAAKSGADQTATPAADLKTIELEDVTVEPVAEKRTNLDAAEEKRVDSEVVAASGAAEEVAADADPAAAGAAVADAAASAQDELAPEKNAAPAHRTASVHRTTGETDIQIDLDLDGSGVAHISTGVPFFDHMLDAFTRHGLFDLTVTAVGDVEVDAHHTVEDTGIVLGQAFAQALGEKRGVTRFADVAVPLDEALVQAVVDLSGRGQAYCQLPLPTERVGTFDTELAVEFFCAFARDARATLHVRELAGANSHHIIEAAFKAAGRAMRRACELDPRVTGIPSTKGSL